MSLTSGRSESESRGLGVTVAGLRERGIVDREGGWRGWPPRGRGSGRTVLLGVWDSGGADDVWLGYLAVHVGGSIWGVGYRGGADGLGVG